MKRVEQVPRREQEIVRILFLDMEETIVLVHTIKQSFAAQTSRVLLMATLAIGVRGAIVMKLVDQALEREQEIVQILYLKTEEKIVLVHIIKRRLATQARLVLLMEATVNGVNGHHALDPAEVVLRNEPALVPNLLQHTEV